MVGMIFPHTGLAGILPNDLPTIEALIDQHKECMSAEDESNRQLAANASIKAMVKDVAQKYDDVKSILDKKSNDALSYLALAAEMSRCVTNTVRLTNEYSEFTRFAADHLKGKPLVAWYAFEANYKVSKEISKANRWLLGMPLKPITRYRKRSRISGNSTLLWQHQKHSSSELPTRNA